MDLTSEFRVGVPVPEAWKVLTDVERIAPMMPGAQLQEVEGDEYRGVVKVKVGPISAQYKGSATFVEQDEAAGRVVLKATGRDTRGQGNASALITATMIPDGDGTKVSVVTDLTITGKVAQFGRGVLAEVSAKLIGQFVDALEADIASGGGAPPADGATVDGSAEAEEVRDSPVQGATSNGSGGLNESASETGASTSGARRIDGPAAEPVDLLAVAGPSTVKRLAPIVGAVLIVLIVVARRRSSRPAKAAF